MVNDTTPELSTIVILRSISNPRKDAFVCRIAEISTDDILNTPGVRVSSHIQKW